MRYEKVDDSTYLLTDTGRQVASLRCSDEEEFLSFFEFLQSSPSSDWELAGAAAASGVTWPAFEAMFAENRERYCSYPETYPPISQAPWKNAAERTKILDTRVELINRIPLYVPDNISIPWLYEENFVNPLVLYNEYNELVTNEVLRRFFVFSSIALFPRASSIYVECFSELLDSGLCIIGYNIPIKVKITALSFKELRTCVSATGRHPARTTSANVTQLEDFLEHDPNAVEQLVNECRDWSEFVGVAYPPDVTWSEYKHFRHQTTAMVKTLRDFLEGWMLKDTRATYRTAHKALLSAV